MVTIKQALSSATFFCTLTAASTFSPATLPFEQATFTQHSYVEVQAASSPINTSGTGLSPIFAVGSRPYHATELAATSAQKTESLLTLLQQRYALSRHKARRLHSAVMMYALQRNVAPDIVLGIIRVESEFKAHAVSPDGAKGLMQVMPKVHEGQIHKLGRTTDDLLETEFNVAMGTSIFADALRRSRGNIRLALARYNGSSDANSKYVSKVLEASLEFKPYMNTQSWS